jgi:ribosome maturation factor RimP
MVGLRLRLGWPAIIFSTHWSARMASPAAAQKQPRRRFTGPLPDGEKGGPQHHSATGSMHRCAPLPQGPAKRLQTLNSWAVVIYSACWFERCAAGGRQPTFFVALAGGGQEVRQVDDSIEKELLAELSAIAESSGCELLEVQFKGGILRLILDRQDGVSLSHCEAVSKQASALLDVTDWGERRYVLEVSSPGLDRPLYGPEDYQRFLGRRVKVTFESPETGVRQTVSGRLDDLLNEGDVTAVVVDSNNRQRHSIPLKNIRLARLEIEL